MSRDEQEVIIRRSVPVSDSVSVSEPKKRKPERSGGLFERQEIVRSFSDLREDIYSKAKTLLPKSLSQPQGSRASGRRDTPSNCDLLETRFASIHGKESRLPLSQRFSSYRKRKGSDESRREPGAEPTEGGHSMDSRINQPPSDSWLNPSSSASGARHSIPSNQPLRSSVFRPSRETSGHLRSSSSSHDVNPFEANPNGQSAQNGSRSQPLAYAYRRDHLTSSGSGHPPLREWEVSSSTDRDEGHRREQLNHERSRRKDREERDSSRPASHERSRERERDKEKEDKEVVFNGWENKYETRSPTSVRREVDRNVFKKPHEPGNYEREREEKKWTQNERPIDEKEYTGKRTRLFEGSLFNYKANKRLNSHGDVTFTPKNSYFFQHDDRDSERRAKVPRYESKPQSYYRPPPPPPPPPLSAPPPPPPPSRGPSYDPVHVPTPGPSRAPASHPSSSGSSGFDAWSSSRLKNFENQRPRRRSPLRWEHDKFADNSKEVKQE